MSISIGGAIKKRASLHILSDNIEVLDTHIQNIIQDAILHSPSPFNCQSGRAVVLLKEEHKKFWDIAYNTAKESVVPPIFEKTFEPVEERMMMFGAPLDQRFRSHGYQLVSYNQLNSTTLISCSSSLFRYVQFLV
ncbi:hypothetical protein MGYG_01573 [Nannizzia gypsea CBS 118893]|uniref:Nitroreductase domain-containing protein n=1 Tax=Arthroderma gypseum (strain ATCC MYA-4604 / CBS 118893) TaxID=535722 RepID=E5R1R2_ARTGP|nr:hypothetical protein MGYG_01573 [Nannizzia gypsea CBS 118893]EFQ98546.1 hypothetical protein MGYG_01573 [Nannizzia gypsea CBS 118893]